MMDLWDGRWCHCPSRPLALSLPSSAAPSSTVPIALPAALLFSLLLLPFLPRNPVLPLPNLLEVLAVLLHYL